MPTKSYYTEQEAAERLDVPRERLETFVRDNKLHARVHAGERMFPAREIEALAGGAADRMPPDADVEDPQGDDPGDTESTGEEASAESLFSDTDEAFLRGYGAGTGLLDLTREAYAAGDVNEAEPGGGTRQVQLIGTALGLSNRLVESHRSELRRVRRDAVIGWAAAGVMVAVCVAVLWWGMTQWAARGQAEIAIDAKQGQVASLNDRLQVGQARLQREEQRVENLNAEYRRLVADKEELRDELSQARMSLTEARSDLKLAESRLSDLTAAAARRDTRLEALQGALAERDAELAALRAESSAANATQE